MSLKEIYEEKVKPKVEKGVEKVKKTGKIVVETFKENPMIGFMALSTVGTVVGGVVNAVNNAKSNEDDHCRSFDAYTGEELVTTRELTNRDVVEVSSRMKAGKTKAEALHDMGLLR